MAGYVRGNYGCNCFYGDSSFKRYNRFHRGGNTIFGNTYNIQYGCCNKGGFWNNFGAGLGYGVGAWLMGGLNMLGGWLGGGFSYNNWGGGYGGADRGSSTQRTRTKVVEKEVEKEVIKEVKVNDKEYAPINSAREKLNVLNAKTNQTRADFDALEAEINGLKSNDGANDPENKLQITLLKADFKKAKDNALCIKTAEELISSPTIEKLTPAALATLPNELKTAIKDLLTDKLKSWKNTDGTYKMPHNNYDVMKYFEVLSSLDSETVVNVEKRSASSDQWIHGSISNVQRDEAGDVIFTVTDHTDDASIGASWKFRTYNDTKVELTGTEHLENTSTYKCEIGMLYDYDENKKCYINKNGRPTAST